MRIIFVWAFMLRGTLAALTPEEAVKQFFAYFKKDAPRGLFFIDPAEPMDLMSPLEVYPMTVEGGQLWGHSQVKIEHGVFDLVTLIGKTELAIPRAEITGHYTVPGLWYSSEGKMNISVLDATLSLNISMYFKDSYILQLKTLQVDIVNDDLAMNMTGLTWEYEILLPSGSAQIFFRQIFDYCYQLWESYIIDSINHELEEFCLKLPKSGLQPHEHPSQSTGSTASDNLLLFLRYMAQYYNADPLELPGEQMSFLGVTLDNFLLEGLSNISQVHNMSVEYKPTLFYVTVKIRCPQLIVHFNRRSVFENARSRITMNVVDFLAKIVLDPSLQVPPLLSKLDLHFGHIGRIRSGRWNFKNIFKGTFNSIVTDVANVLDRPIKHYVQKVLNRIDVEEEVLKAVRSEQQKTI